MRLFYNVLTAGATSNYSWILPGTYTVAITVTNPCNIVAGTFEVEVQALPEYHRIYLPLVVRG